MSPNRRNLTRALALALTLLVPLAASAGGAQRGARTAKRVVIDVSPQKVKRGATAEYKTKLRAGQTRTRRAKVTVFGNDEMSVQLQRDVAGRDVSVVHGEEHDAPAVSTFRTLHAIEAAHMGRARSVSVSIDKSLSRRYGREFLNDLLAGLEVDTVSHVGDGDTEDVDLVSRDRPARFRTQPRTGRSLLWGGSSHPELLRALGKRLRKRAGQVGFDRTKGDLQVSLPSDPAGRDVFLVQSKRVSNPEQFHEDMLEMLRMAWDAKKAGAGEITAILPYLPYSRSDRMDSPGISVGAALLPKLLKRVGVNRVVFYSVHQAQEVGIFQALNMQVLHASGEGILASRTAAEIRDQGFAMKDLVVMAPDAGAEKRARVFARALARELGVQDIPLVTASKERNVDQISLRFNADVKGKVAIAIDDETASGGTLNELGKAANNLGARRVYAAVSHLTGPAYQKIDSKAIGKLFVLDTLPQERTRAAGHPSIEVVSVADHLATLVKRIDQNKPVDDLIFLEHP
jgi:ribose-phosphate pyrophosphokinase